MREERTGERDPQRRPLLRPRRAVQEEKPSRSLRKYVRGKTAPGHRRLLQVRSEGLEGGENRRSVEIKQKDKRKNQAEHKEHHESTHIYGYFIG